MFHPRRRSALYLPASNPKAIAKARTLPCDIVILDLEDAVAPEAKADARDAAVAAVQEGGFGDREIIVRINGLDTPWGEDDVAALTRLSAPRVLVPKINNAADIEAYETKCANKSLQLWAMIETARCIFRLEEIAATAERGTLTGFVMGTNDLAKELGAEPDILRAPFTGFLAQAVAAARAYGLAILDGVFNDIEDEDGFTEQTKQAVAFGFDGKTLIHPRQIELCNAAFVPSAAAVAWARRVIAAFDLPTHAGKGAIRVDGKMVERLHLAQAQRTLAAANIETAQDTEK